MSQDDRICQEDLDATQAVVRRMYQTAMTAAVLGGLLFAVLCGLAKYFVSADRSLFAALVVGLFGWLFFGVPLALHYWRHYRSIFQQLTQLRQRILAGDVVYGSQFTFHRHAA